MTTTPESTLDLSIITVSWNVWPLLQDLLQSIEHFSRPSRDLDPSIRSFGNERYTVEVIIVDGASSDETTALLPKQFPWVRLIQNDENLGFTCGNNMGYRASRGRSIFFLNPDTKLVDSEQAIPQDVKPFRGRHRDNSGLGDMFVPPPEDEIAQSSAGNPLVQLYTILQNEPDLGVIGPQLRYGDGSWQNSRRRFPTRWTGFFESTWLGLAWSENPWTRRMHMLDESATEQHEVDWLNGSALFCRRSALESIRDTADPGPFDEQFFMYSEELDLCQRVNAAGWRIAYVPQVQIIHYEGRSSEQVVTRRHILFNTSKVRYYQKYFGTFWAMGLRTYLRLEYIIQIGIETLKLLLRHRPDLRRSRIYAYREILQHGFQ